MSSVTKPISAGTSPVTSTRAGTGSARPVSSQYGAVSELYAQTGVRGEDEHRGFEDYQQGGGNRQHERDQPSTLKLRGTSRTFAMLFEESQQDLDSYKTDSYYGQESGGGRTKPAFQAYMSRATSTYELNIRAINGENRNRGGSINIAM